MPAPVVTQLIVDASGARQGVAEFEAAMAKAKAAAVDGGNATAQSFESAQRRWVQSLGATDPVIRAQIRMKDDLAKQEAINTKAVQLGIATSDAAKAQMDAVRQKHEQTIQTIREQTGQLTTNEKAWQGLKNATSGVSGQLIALAAGAGPVGVFLSALGPWGIAAAIGLGAVSSTLSFVSDKTHELAQKGKEIKEFAEATGFTTLQFQATRSEMGKFGIDAQTMTAGISKFTAGFAELRNGQGALLTDIRRINPALAEQMQGTTDAATAFTLFGRAVAETDNIFQRNQLLKAGMGKGSAVFGAFFETRPDVSALTSAFAAAGKGIDDNLIKKLAQLQIDIEKTRAAANTIFATAFGTSTLEAEKQYANLLLDIAKTFKVIADHVSGMKFPDVPDWMKVGTKAFQYATNPTLAVVDAVKYGSKAGAKAYDDKPVSMADFQSPVNDYSRFQKTDTVAEASKKTIEANAAAWKDYISIIGSAATPQERMNALISELTVKARDAGRGGEELAKGIAALRFDEAISQQQAHNAALGASVPISDIVIAKGQQLQKLQMAGANITPQQIAFQKQLTAEQALGTYQIQSQIDLEKVKQGTIGLSVGAAAAYTAEQTRLNKARQDGQVLSPPELKALQDKALALGAVAQASAQASAQSQADFALQTVFMSDTEKQIAAINFQLHGNAWKDFMNDGLSATMRLTANLDVMVSGLKDVGKAAFSSALQGKLGMDQLIGTLDGVAKKLSDKAFDNLTSLDPDKMVVGAVQAGASALISAFTGDQKQKQELEKAKQTWAAMADQVRNFRLAAEGFTLGPLTNELQSLYSTAKQLQDAAFKAKDFSGEAAVAKSFNNAVERIWTEFKNGNQVLTPLQQQMKSVNDEAAGLRDTLSDIGFAGRAAAIDDIVKQQIEALTKQFNATFISGLTARLNTANGQTFLNDAANLLVQHQQDLASAGDLGNDPTLLAQVAATFHAEAQKIVDDAGLVGDAFADFTKQFPDLAGVVVSATDDMSSASKQLQATLNGHAKTIVDFVNSLYASSSSTQSPTAQLASAQLAYNTKLGLAQGGNVDALASITTDAQNLLTAARGVFASSTGYQSIFNSVTAQLLNLPAVQNTTDPAVQAMRDVLTAVNLTNSIQTGQLLPAVTAGNAANVAAALSAYFNQIDPTGKLNSVVANTLSAANTSAGYLPGVYLNTGNTNANVNASNIQLDAIKSLNDTSKSFLGGINTFSDRIIQAINSQGGMQAGNYAKMILNSAILLNWMPKLVTTGKESAGGDGGGISDSVPYTAHAAGGVIPPYGLGLVSEHAPGGGRFLRAGPEPITVSPFPAQPSFRGSNDNGNSAALIAALMKRIDQLETVLSQATIISGRQVERAVRETSDDQVEATDGNGKRVAYALTQAAKEAA